MGRLSNRCTDWLRQHRGRTRWQFAGHTYEPTIPKPVSLDAPAAGDDGSTVGENVGRVDDDLEACFAAAASAGAGTLREQTPPTEPAQPSNVSADPGQPCRFPPPPGTAATRRRTPWRFKSSHPHPPTLQRLPFRGAPASPCSVRKQALRAGAAPPRAQGRRQMILPAYPVSAGIDSVLVTMHVPRCVSIGSPGWGGAGNSTFSTSSKLAPWMVMM